MRSFFVIPIKTSRTDNIQKMQKELRGRSHEMNFLHNKVFSPAPGECKTLYMYMFLFEIIFTLCSSLQQYLLELYRTTADIMIAF